MCINVERRESKGLDWNSDAYSYACLTLSRRVSVKIAAVLVRSARGIGKKKKAVLRRKDNILDGVGVYTVYKGSIRAGQFCPKCAMLGGYRSRNISCQASRNVSYPVPRNAAGRCLCTGVARPRRRRGVEGGPLLFTLSNSALAASTFVSVCARPRQTRLDTGDCPRSASDDPRETHPGHRRSHAKMQKKEGNGLPYTIPPLNRSFHILFGFSLLLFLSGLFHVPPRWFPADSTSGIYWHRTHKKEYVTRDTIIQASTRPFRGSLNFFLFLHEIHGLFRFSSSGRFFGVFFVVFFWFLSTIFGQRRFRA